MTQTFMMPASAAAEEREAAAKAVAKMGDWFTRLQLYSSKSKAVIKKEIPAGHYGIEREDEIQDLGEDIDLLVLAGRSKALDMNGGGAVSIFEEASPEFLDIKERSWSKNSKCMWGPEFLVYHEDIGFVTLYFGTKSMRKVSGQFLKYRIKPGDTEIRGVNLTVDVVDDGENVWEVPIIGTSALTPMFPGDAGLLEKTLNKFYTEKSTKRIVANTDADAGGRKR